MNGIYRRRNGEIKPIVAFSFDRKPDRLLKLGDKIQKETGLDSVCLSKAAFGLPDCGKKKRAWKRYKPSAPLNGAVK
jgi:hypothetical protein